MSKKTLEAGIWLCVNPGSAYAAGVEVTINVEKTTANLRYEWKNSDSVAPNYIDDISEPIQTLYVKAVDGKGFLWLISQSVDVNIQIESITPAFTTVTFPTGMASETKQDDQITELQAIKTAVQTVAAESDATTITGYIDSVGVRFLTRFDPTATQKIKHYRLDSGTAYSPVAPFEPISSNVEVFNYVATAAGTGYSINDILVKFTDTETKSSAWRNETTNLAISSPISGTYSEIGKVGAATLAEQNKQTIELNLANELAYREATKTYTTLKTWAQYKVVNITGWAVGVVVGDFVYKETNKLTNALQWLKSDGVTTIAAPANEDVNVDQLTGDREISVVYSSVFGAVSKTRAPTIKNGIYNFGTVETEGSWV